MLLIFYLPKGDTHVMLKSLVISSKIEIINTFNLYIIKTALTGVNGMAYQQPLPLLVTGHQTPFPSLRIQTLSCAILVFG